MPYIFYLLLIIIFTALTIYRIEWGFLAVAALLPAYLMRFSFLGVPTTLLEMMIYILFAAWFFRYSGLWKVLRGKESIKGWIRRKGASRYPLDIEIILLLIISFIAVAISGFSNTAFGVWKAYFFDPILFYIVAINYISGGILSGSKLNGETRILHNTSPVIPGQAGIQGYTDEKVDTRLLGNDKEGDFRILPIASLQSQITKILFALSISALSVSIFAIYQKITGQFIPEGIWQAEATRRVVSIFEYPNAVGLYLGPLMAMLIGWLFVESNGIITINQKSKIKNPTDAIALVDKQNYNLKFKIIKILYIAFVSLISLLSIYFAKSEGALIGIIAALFIFGLLSGKLLRRITISATIIAVIIAASYAPLRTYAIDKITLNDFSGQVRKLQWQETWEMLKDGRLITGSGLANYQKFIKPYHQEGFFYNKDNDPDFQRKIIIFDDHYKSKYWQPLEIYLYPHNIFLNFWTELGLAGMLLFAWIFVKLLYLGIKNLNVEFYLDENKYLQLGLTAGLIVILVHGLVDVPYFKNDLAAIFWLLAAMIGYYNAALRNFQNT